MRMSNYDEARDLLSYNLDETDENILRKANVLAILAVVDELKAQKKVCSCAQDKQEERLQKALETFHVGSVVRCPNGKEGEIRHIDKQTGQALVRPVYSDSVVVEDLVDLRPAYGTPESYTDRERLRPFGIRESETSSP